MNLAKLGDEHLKKFGDKLAYVFDIRVIMLRVWLCCEFYVFISPCF